jgi:hypothetical protein
MMSAAWGMSCPITLLRCTRSVVCHCPIGSSHHCNRAYEWSTGLPLHCSHMPVRLACFNDASCLYILHALIIPHIRMSCMP